MKQEETLHSLSRTTKTIERNLQNLELRIQNLKKSKQSKLKNLHSQILLQHQSMISPRSKREIQPKPLPKPKPNFSTLPGIEKMRESVEDMKKNKFDMARQVKIELMNYKAMKKEQEDVEKENMMKNRNYQRLRALESKEKIDQYWNTKIDFYRNQKLRNKEDLRRKIMFQQSKFDTLREEEESLMREINNVSKMKKDFNQTVSNYDAERDKGRATIQSWHSSKTTSPQKLKYIKLQ